MTLDCPRCRSSHQTSCCHPSYHSLCDECARARRAALAEEGDAEVADKIDASLAACCDWHAKFGICYNDPEDER